MHSANPHQSDSGTHQPDTELEAERNRNLDLTERLRAAEAARNEAAALLARATHERALLRRRADLAEREVGAARRSANAAMAENRAIRESMTWQATYPVRWLAGRMPEGARRATRGAVKLVWWTLTLRLVRELRSRSNERRARTDAPEARNRPFDLMPPVLGPPGDPAGRREPIDIVIHVHAATADIKTCLDALIRYTLPPCRVILIDTASPARTAERLRRAADEQGFTLLRFDAAKGFAFAANAGIRAANAAWVVLLNGDAMVSPGWLDRLWAYAVADPEIGVIGPISDRMRWQPPARTDGESEADAIEAMARLAASASRGVLAMPFPDRFCYMIRRAAIDRIGLLDEDMVGFGDAAIDDYSIRARQAGWKLVVASDVFVGLQHAEAPDPDPEFAAALARKHDPGQHILPQVAFCRENLALHALRARLDAKLSAERLRQQGRQRFEGLRLAIVLPEPETALHGQAVLSDARALERMGVDVALLTVDARRDSRDRTLRLGDLPTEVFDSPESLSLYLGDLGPLYDCVVATAWQTVYWLPSDLVQARRCVRYLQDFEPALLADDEPERLPVLRSFDVHGGIPLLAKSRWIQGQLRQHLDKFADALEPSVEIDPFGPADGRIPGETTAALSIVVNMGQVERRRGARRAIDVLQSVVAQAGVPISVQTFGASDTDLARSWLWNFGELSQGGLARLLSYADIYVDLSDCQPAGTRTLEAMLSGAAVVAPQAGASSEFIRHGANGVLVDILEQGACADQILRLVRDPALRGRLQVAAIDDAHACVPERSALKLLEAIAPGA